MQEIHVPIARSVCVPRSKSDWTAKFQIQGTSTWGAGVVVGAGVIGSSKPSPEPVILVDLLLDL